MVKKGDFRVDLYYRLNGICINIPPLRERPEDIIALIGFYMKRFNEKYQTCKFLSPEALEVLQNYEWPGNIRELINLIERLILTVPKEKINEEDLPDYIKNKSC